MLCAFCYHVLRLRALARSLSVGLCFRLEFHDYSAKQTKTKIRAENNGWFSFFSANPIWAATATATIWSCPLPNQLNLHRNSSATFN